MEKKIGKIGLWEDNREDLGGERFQSHRMEEIFYEKDDRKYDIFPCKLSTVMYSKKYYISLGSMIIN